MRVGNRYEFCVGNTHYKQTQKVIENRLNCIGRVSLRCPQTRNPMRLLVYAIMQGYAKLCFRISFRSYHQAYEWMQRVRLESQLYRDARFVDLFNRTSAHLEALYGGHRVEYIYAAEPDCIFDDEIDFDLLEMDTSVRPDYIVIDNISYTLAPNPFNGRVRYVPSLQPLPTRHLTAPVFFRQNGRFIPPANLRRAAHVSPARFTPSATVVVEREGGRRRQQQPTTTLPSQPARGLTGRVESARSVDTQSHLGRLPSLTPLAPLPPLTPLAPLAPFAPMSRLEPARGLSSLGQSSRRVETPAAQRPSQLARQFGQDAARQTPARNLQAVQRRAGQSLSSLSSGMVGLRKR